MGAGAARQTHKLRAVVPADEFRGALDRGEVRLYYQPQIDLGDGSVRGAEALIRWQHPTGGLLPPDDFLPALAHTPVMPTITAWAVRAACAEAAGWEEGHSVSVNIAAADTMTPALADAVEAALETSNVPPSRLTLEVTEHSLVRDLEHATTNLRRLSGAGVRISLDDFGTGYSSLLYLRELPIAEIKIDCRFVAGVGDDPDDDGIVAGLVKLGHAVGVRVVAEGVETKKQAARLVELGCDAAQGFLYGCPAEQFTPQDVRVDHPTAATQQPTRRRRRGRATATPEALAVIRTMVTEGASLHTIAAALNQQGMRTAEGARWVGATVGRAVADL